jgi:hypothetical protein
MHPSSETAMSSSNVIVSPFVAVALTPGAVDVGPSVRRQYAR